MTNHVPYPILPLIFLFFFPPFFLRSLFPKERGEGAKEGCQGKNASKGRAIIIVVCFVDIHGRDRQTASSSPIDSLNGPHHHHPPHSPPPTSHVSIFFLCFPSRLPFSLLCACRCLFNWCCLLLWARGRPIDQTDRPPSLLSLQTQTLRRQPAQPIQPSDRPSQSTTNQTNLVSQLSKTERFRSIYSSSTLHPPVFVVTQNKQNAFASKFYSKQHKTMV